MENKKQNDFEFIEASFVENPPEGCNLILEKQTPDLKDFAEYGYDVELVRQEYMRNPTFKLAVDVHTIYKLQLELLHKKEIISLLEDLEEFITDDSSYWNEYKQILLKKHNVEK
jgi:hypothetical protein